jgi:hypothetical protein
MTVDFCPVCGGASAALHARCERVGLYYGYTLAELGQLAAQKASIAVPFFDVNRLLFCLDHLAKHPMAPIMVEAVEQSGSPVTPQEFGNLVRVLPFTDSRFPGWQDLYSKDDVSKTTVVYQYQDAIEHLGSEERAIAFAEIAARFFGLGDHVPPTAMGLSSAGTKFVVSAGFSRERFASLKDRPRDLSQLWREGTLARLALLDFVLGQNDRSDQNILVSTDEPVRIGLIDNDESFVAHERLLGRFAYLEGLDGNLRFDIAQDWFTFRLADLLALLSPLSLPEITMTALCRRFAFARWAVGVGLSLADFTHAVFVERAFITWQLPNVTWAICQPLIKESAQGTLYRTLVGERVGDVFRITVLDGKLLNPEVTTTEVAVEASAANASATLASLAADGLGDGYVHVVRRRLFVGPFDTIEKVPSNDDLRIVEVRDDLAGFHVVVKQGHLSYYDARRVAKFISFATSEAALAQADAIEEDLLASGFTDLRARLASFKASGPPTLF